MSVESQVHRLINKQRKRHGASYVRWSRELASLARSQAKYCAKTNHLVHSNRSAFRGGENLAQGDLHFNAHSIVSCWMHSKAGHREYLLSPRVTQAGVGIARSRNKTYVAWAFSDTPIIKLPTIHLIPKIHFPKRIKLTAPNFITMFSLAIAVFGFYSLFTDLAPTPVAILIIILSSIIWANRYIIAKQLKKLTR